MSKELESQVKVLIEIHKEDRDLINKLEAKIKHYEELMVHYSILIQNIQKITLNLKTIDTINNLYENNIKWSDVPDKIKRKLIKACERD